MCDFSSHFLSLIVAAGLGVRWYPGPRRQSRGHGKLHPVVRVSFDSERVCLTGIRMKEMRDAVHADAGSSGNKELILTVAGPSDPAKLAMVQAKEVSQYLDWFNVMTYE